MCWRLTYEKINKYNAIRHCYWRTYGYVCDPPSSEQSFPTPPGSAGVLSTLCPSHSAPSVAAANGANRQPRPILVDSFASMDSAIVAEQGGLGTSPGVASRQQSLPFRQHSKKKPVIKKRVTLRWAHTWATWGKLWTNEHFPVTCTWAEMIQETFPNFGPASFQCGRAATKDGTFLWFLYQYKHQCTQTRSYTHQHGDITIMESLLHVDVNDCCTNYVQFLFIHLLWQYINAACMKASIIVLSS